MGDLKKNIERALQVVSELCRGERTWVMHVPVQEDDPDIIITNGLLAGEEAIKQLAATREVLHNLYLAVANDLRHPDDDNNWTYTKELADALSKANNALRVEGEP